MSDLSKIGNNENNISSNLRKIDTNKNNISSNLGKIGNYENNISSNLDLRNTNKNNILYNLNQINDIKSIFPTFEIFKKHIVLSILFYCSTKKQILFVRKTRGSLSLKIFIIIKDNSCYYTATIIQIILLVKFTL